MQHKPARIPIPLPMAREIRQRCGFGCVICGLPLYEYEHLLGYSIVQRHAAEEITLLCDHHHREKTNGLLPADVVIAANADPYNLRTGTSKPYTLHYSGTECEANVGSNIFTTADLGYGTLMIPVSVDGIPLVGFILTDGQLLLNLNLFDEYNQPILSIENNALVYKPTAWDIRFVGRRLTIRKQKRKVVLDLYFDVPNKIRIVRGLLFCNGVKIEISESKLVINDHIRLRRSVASLCDIGVKVGTAHEGLRSAFDFPLVSRYNFS